MLLEGVKSTASVVLGKSRQPKSKLPTSVVSLQPKLPTSVVSLQPYQTNTAWQQDKAVTYI